MRRPPLFLMILQACSALTVCLTPPALAQDRHPRAGNLIDDRLAVHEWGTFTCLQDEDGGGVGGINTDDEPVPEFVWELKRFLLIKPTELPPVFFQGAPHCHPDVTMRLETPVVYFHLPKKADSRSVPVIADVEVGFHGGWLTQYFPNAEVFAPGLHEDTFEFGPIRPDESGTLYWKKLKIGTAGTGPQTESHVWTAPRAVDAAAVTTFRGESEKFLFYRGVGHLDAPLRVAQEAGRGPKAQSLALRGQVDPGVEFLNRAGLTVSRLWLVDVRDDRATAFRTLGPLEVRAGGPVLAKTAAAFEAGDYAAGNLSVLRQAMRDALVAAGLFGDEADALLNTWEASYFKSPGLRLFFLVPRKWTDWYLPLSVSVPANITRVMVGRIELVSPSQRELLRRIAAGPASDGKWYWNSVDNFGGSNERQRQWGEIWKRVADEGAPVTEFGVPIPDDYRAYLALGRFRNALVLDQVKRQPTDALRQFIGAYGLDAYQGPAAASQPAAATRPAD